MNLTQKLSELWNDKMFAVLGQLESLSELLVLLILTAVFSFLLGRFYIKYANTLSNRRSLAYNFILLSCTTMLVIYFVKSSLALSLGLVGALSIVRFRSAIKEPEELVFIFLSIALGLGFGAGYAIPTIAGFSVLLLIIRFNKGRAQNGEFDSYFLVINTKDLQALNLKSLVDIVKANSIGSRLKRYDEQPSELEASFALNLAHVGQLLNISKEVRSLDQAAVVTYMDANNEL